MKLTLNQQIRAVPQPLWSRQHTLMKDKNNSTILSSMKL